MFAAMLRKWLAMWKMRLLEIFETEGKMGIEEAHLYLKRLRAAKRYQRDVY